MTTPITKSFTQLVSDMVTAIQGAAATLVDTSIGSILRSIVESVAAVILWLQGLILQLLATTRAATSNASDLDSWMADYGLTRLAAVAASGSVTFSRFTPTLQAVVPIGAKVQTADGTQTYAVTVDTTNPAYSSAQGGYVLVVNTASVTVPVLAQTHGSAGNAAPGFINTITTSISGVDTCANALQFTTGADAETDAAFRIRFIAYVANLSKATKSAIGFAISSIQAGVSWQIVENLTYAGAAASDYFYVIVDDGTGNPSSAFLTAATKAVDATRPVTSTFNVFAPVIVTANVALTMTAATGYSHATLASTIQTAIQAYIDGLGVGQALEYSRIIQVAYDATAGIQNITATTLNGGTADLSCTFQQRIMPGTITVN